MALHSETEESLVIERRSLRMRRVVIYLAIDEGPLFDDEVGTGERLADFLEGDGFDVRSLEVQDVDTFMLAFDRDRGQLRYIGGKRFG